MVSGHGNNQPRVILIADHAQGEDLKTNYALSGFKENLLRTFCQAAKLNYNDLYRTCLIKADLPEPDEKFGKTASDAEKANYYISKVVPEYSNILIQEIRDLNPNLLVPLGEISFQFLTGLEGIRKFRGSVLKADQRLTLSESKEFKVLPILGPFPYLYTDYKQKLITQIDFNKIQKWSGDQPIPDDTYRIWVAKSSTAVRNFVERAYPICAAKSIEEGGFLVFDIETYMNIPTCISFCFDGFESCCIPILDTSIDSDVRTLMWQLVAEVLASPIPKVNQNIKYDWKTLERWGFKVNNIVGDSMLAASTLYCEFPKNLGFLTSIYTDLPYFKDEGRQFDPSKHKKEQFYLYNAKDSLSTHQIYTKQIAETKELGTNYVYEKLIELMPVYRRMEDRGIRIDDQRRKKLLAKYETLFHIHSLNLNRLLSQSNLNPLSSSVMNRVVFDEIGYKKIRGVTGTDEESLNMLMAFGTPEKARQETGKEILQEIIWCRKLHKVIEILELPLYPDQRFRCEFNLAGTEMGRTSAGKTTDYFIYGVNKPKGQKVKTENLGHSLQTIGKHGFWIGETLYGTDIRSMYVPSAGYRFVEIDLSGAEARVDRVLSGNFDLSVFDNPGIHKLTGSWVFGCKPEEIKKNTLQYHLSKTVRHAGERNMKENRFFLMAQDEGTGVNLTLPEAKKILDLFHKHEPEIRGVFHRGIKAALSATDCLIAPNGRRRDFFDRPSEHQLGEAISFLPQAIVSDQNKFSFIKTFSEATWAFLLAEAHDAGFSEVPIGREGEFVEIYKRNIETPIDFRQGSLRRDFQLVIPCEVSVGDDWENMEDWKC